MVYLLWKKKLRDLIELEFELKNHLNWESWCDWKEYFLQGYSPENAIKDAHSTN